MGYYTRIDLHEVRVRPEKLEEVAAALAAAEGENTEPFGLGMLELEDGDLWWNPEFSSVHKWRNEEELIGVLAGWCSRGWVAFWSCEGDGSNWGYELDGAGGFTECSGRRVSALRGAATRRRRKKRRDSTG